MKFRMYIAIMVMAVFGLGMVCPAGALVTAPNTVSVTVETANATQSVGATFTVDVKASDIDYQNAAGKKAKVAAGAVTMIYNTAVLEVVNGGGELNRITDVLSDLFGFVEDKRTNPGTPAQDYARIGNDKSTEGKLMLSGANAGDSAKTGSQNLFQVKFKVKTTATPGATGNITLARTVPPADANTGWDGTASVDPLVGVLENWSATPNDLTDDFQVIPVTLGAALTITVSSMVDTDVDGIDDNWETTNFGNLTTATATSDYDLDGYTDLVEYQNGTDPKTQQAAGGSGYDEKSDARLRNPDVDGNGVLGQPDVTLFLRWYFQWPNDASFEGRNLGAGATRTTAAEIRAYCSLLDDMIFDIDGNGVFGQPDVTLFLRWYFQWPNDASFEGRNLGAGATRTTAAEIRAYCEKLKANIQ